MHHLSALIKHTPLHQLLRNWIIQRREKQALIAWERNGRTGPPPHVIKQQTLLWYARQHKLNVLVETGTYLGDMVAAMRANFERIYSIEISNELYKRAKQRFAGDDKIILIHGDSGRELAAILDQLQQPALFWLDGHYSAGVTGRGEKETPIFEELTHIFNAEPLAHVIVIDDVHCFGTEPGYPSIEDLRLFVEQHRPDTEISINDNSIRITPR